MFGGKTSELYRQLNLKVDLGLKVLYINSRLDTRSDKPSSTHGSAGSYLSPSIETIKSEHLNNIDVSGYDVIGVDEGQFFENLDPIIDWVDALRKMVFLVSLDGGWDRKPFGRALELIPYADKVKKLRANCMKCLSEHKIIDAPFTGSHVNVGEKATIKQGGRDIYQALCRVHYLELHGGYSLRDRSIKMVKREIGNQVEQLIEQLRLDPNNLKIDIGLNDLRASERPLENIDSK